MAITYPISLVLAPRHVEFELQTSAAKSQSRFTKQSQILLHQGDIWLATFEYPPMVRADAEELIGRLLSLRGTFGTFLLGPTGAAKTPRGIATGFPLVNGAGQTGYTLLTKDWTAGQTGIVKIGDWLSFGTSVEHLYKVAQDADSDGSGLATIELCNRIRVATTDNDPISLNSPMGTFRLANPAQRFSVNQAQHYGLVIEAEEAL